MTKTHKKKPQNHKTLNNQEMIDKLITEHMTFIQRFKHIWQNITNWIQNIFTKIGECMQTWMKKFIENTQTVNQHITHIIQTSLSFLKQIFQNIWDFLNRLSMPTAVSQ